MTAPRIVDPAGLLSEALSEASPDLMRSLRHTMIVEATTVVYVGSDPWSPGHVS